MFFRIAALFAGAVVALAQEIPADALDRAKLLTVMLDCLWDGDNIPGSGIIFAIENDRAYIATANHNVRRGVQESSRVKVLLKWLPGEPLDAAISQDADPGLDLAVLVVRGVSSSLTQGAGLTFDRIGNPAAYANNAPVWALGFPNGVRWDVSDAERLIAPIGAYKLEYRSRGLVSGGFSGGPLLDHLGRLIGLVRQDKPPNAEATRIDSIVTQLKAWGYHVQLSEGADRSSNPPEVAKAPSSSTESTTKFSQGEFKTVLRTLTSQAEADFGGHTTDWTPTVQFSNGHCYGFSRESMVFLDCYFAETVLMLDVAEMTFLDMINQVKSALPDWGMDNSHQNEWDNPPLRWRRVFYSRPENPKVSVRVVLIENKDNTYSVYVEVMKYR